MECYDDDFCNLNPKEFCKQIGSQADFNDHYYHELFVGKDIPIVTDDGDFIFQDIEIITNNKNLIKIYANPYRSIEKQ